MIHYNNFAHTLRISCVWISFSSNLSLFWVLYAFFIKENGSIKNAVRIKGVFCRLVRVTVGVLVSANKPHKPMACNSTGWLMFDYFQKVQFSTRYMWCKTYYNIYEGLVLSKLALSNPTKSMIHIYIYIFLSLVITSFTSNLKFKLVLTLRATLTRFSYLLISYNSLFHCYRCTLVLRCIDDTL